MARWPGLGSASAATPNRCSYQLQTNAGSLRYASGVASCMGSYCAQRPGLGLAEGRDAGFLADAGAREHRELGRPGQGARRRLQGVVGTGIVEPLAHGSLLGRVLPAA